VTRLFTSENKPDLMALLEMLQGFLTMLARDLAMSLLAMIHGFVQMTDAFTNMSIPTFFHGCLGMRLRFFSMFDCLIGMAHFSMSFGFAGMANRLMKMRVTLPKTDSRNHEYSSQCQHPTHSLQC
jgi:hypothetical protein